MLLALRLVKFTPETAGNWLEPFNCTSWLAPLKVFPCNVTFADNRASARVPELILLALRPVKLAPEPEKLPAIIVPEMLILPISCTPGLVAWSEVQGPLVQVPAPAGPWGP